MSSPRTRAFEKPAPTFWKPLAGDEVFLPPRSPYLNNSTAIVALELGDVCKVRYQFSGYVQYRMVLTSDLRPTGRWLVDCVLRKKPTPESDPAP